MNLTTKQVHLMCKFIADYNGGEPEDYVHEPIDTTSDSFDRYDGQAWAEAKGREDDDDYGVPARYFESVQAAKGQPRTQLWIMDFGECRAVYQL